MVGNFEYIRHQDCPEGNAHLQSPKKLAWLKIDSLVVKNVYTLVIVIH